VSSKTFWKSLALAALLVAGSDLPASAQIYTWRDSAGNLVLSNRRSADAESVTSYANANANTEGARTTREVTASQSSRFDDLIVEHARRHGIRQSLVRAVIQVESAFNPQAMSNKGAMGLMQLMPATAREFGVRNAFNPAENVRGGVAYLRQLLDRYDNNEQLALAAYNAGPGAVDKHGQHIPPYQETRNYVSKVNQIAGRAKPAAAGTQIYKRIELVDGHEVVKYTDRPQ
jgi:soluble lytic murein transglycosylase-like protein